MTAAALPLLREVRLYGPLRARFGRSHWLAVDSPAEAVQALCALFNGFREAVLGHKGPGYRVIVGDGPRADLRGADALPVTASPGLCIRIAPVIHGNKRGIGMIIAGIALIMAAPYLFAYIGSAVGSGTVGAMVWQGSLAIGKALVLGGIVQLLSPQRTGSGTQAKNETSYAFNGPTNVSSEGGPVPVIIGRMMIGSTTVSAGLSTDDYTPPASAAPASPALAVGEVIDWLQYRDAP